MLSFLPKPLVGIIAICLYTLNLSFWFTLLLLTALGKWLIPMAKWRRTWQHLLDKIPPAWVMGNNFIMWLTSRTRFEITGLENLDPNTWYLLLANHQAWSDILVLFRVFAKRVAPVRFFLKEELRWLPFVGQACWILDFPFMKRHSSKALARHPELRLQDIETTRKACAKFKDLPITLINFAEGTRFRSLKHQKQQSPYKHLLKPKAGGIAFTLAAMPEKLQQILDVTIVYAPHRANFWDFCCGKIEKVTLAIRVLPIPGSWRGDYVEDKVFRQAFQAQINQLWQEKDVEIDELLRN